MNRVKGVGMRAYRGDGRPNGWRLAVLMLVALLAASGDSAALAQHEDMPPWLRERLGGRYSNRRDNIEMMRLIKPVTEPLARSVVEVLSGGQVVALGTVVSEAGHVLTKGSELGDEPVRVRLADDRLLPARIAAVRRESDLALLATESDERFAPVEFAPETPPIGSFLISPGRDGRPAGLGAVGVRQRRVDHQGRLGVVLRQSREGDGALVHGIWPDSGADRAGVRLGDRIVAINGERQPDRDSVIRKLKQKYPGETVHLTIERDGDPLELDARMRELRVMQESENDAMVNGPRSRRLTGFEQVIQHDTVLDPNRCGGPVVDSSGRVVGLNIARAGRVVSYALPAELVIAERDRLLEEVQRQAESAEEVGLAAKHATGEPAGQ